MKNEGTPLNNYYMLLQENLFQEKLIIDSLIEPKQKYTRGILYEDIIRRALKKILPANLTVAQGFVDFNGIKSPQCDIIIFDSANYSPLLSVDSFVLIPYQAVNAIIEIKAKIGRREIKQTLKNFQTILELSEINSIRKYLIGFDSINFKNFPTLSIFDPFPEALDIMMVLKKGIVWKNNSKCQVIKTNDSFLLFVLKLMETYYFNTGRLGMKKNPYENYIKKFNVEFIS